MNIYTQEIRLIIRAYESFINSIGYLSPELTDKMNNARFSLYYLLNELEAIK